jgi:hypothetical protein
MAKQEAKYPALVAITEKPDGDAIADSGPNHQNTLMTGPDLRGQATRWQTPPALGLCTV